MVAQAAEMGSRRCRRRRTLPGSRPEMRGRTCLGRTLTREYRPVMLGKIHTARGWKAFSGFLRMSCGGCSRHRQGAARCPILPEHLPRTPYPAALLNFSFCRRGPLDKPRGARYAMHRHHPPGGCYDRVERPSDSIGSSLERAYCQRRHHAKTDAPPRGVSRQRGRTANAGTPPAQKRGQGRRIANAGILSRRIHAICAKARTRQVWESGHATEANA